jgi:hypothetical protein
MPGESHSVMRTAIAACWVLSALFCMNLGATGVALAGDKRADSRQRFIEVDKEIQAVKQEVLEINREIMLLEEQLLYPHDQQLLVFVTLSNNGSLDVASISLTLDGKRVSQHAYSQTERAALNQGGAHRLYVGRLENGVHELHVSLAGTSAQGQTILREQSAEFVKGSKQKVMELNIVSGDNGKDPEFTIHQW